jgi:hypothetical protein
MALKFIAGQAQRSMLIGGLNLMGVPGETMRRMREGLKPLPYSLLIAAWKTASRQGVGSQRGLKEKVRDAALTGVG